MTGDQLPAASIPPTYPTPLDESELAATWDACWSGIGRRAPDGLRAELLAAWSEPQRHYHDRRHLGECLALWTRWRAHSPHPAEVGLALWFHDAVYDVHPAQPGSNELRSAAWAARTLARAGAGSDTVQRVHDLVMATQHGAPDDEASAAAAANADVQVLVDIDLSILGSPTERFERYEQDVRREYAWVAGRRYQEGRAQVLQGFLDRPKLYATPTAAALLETQARINLSAALSRLAQ